MTPQNPYNFKFSGLKLGNHRLNWDVGLDLFTERGVQDFTAIDAKAAIEVEKKERFMNLTFDLTGEIELTCDRCGDPLKLGLDTNNGLVIRFAHETDFSDDEVIFLDDTAYQIDLGQFIYEFIMVGLPSRRIHEEGSCNKEVEEYLKEAQPKAEVEVEEKNEVDPRWEALKKFK